MRYPAGYPLALSTSTESARTSGGSPATAPTKDQRPALRLSARQVAAIAGRLSARDRDVLATVRRFRVMSGEQLQRLFWPDGSAETRARLARHGLARLCKLGVLTPLGRRVGGVRAGSQGRTFAVGIAGQRLLATGDVRRARAPHTPGERYLAHTLAVARLYVELTEAGRWGLLDLLGFDPEPDCWRPFAGAYGARLTLKPDAALRIGVGDYELSWLIEMDMATEALPTIERKGRAHLSYHQSGAGRRRDGIAPRVAWIVPDEARAEAIQTQLGRLPASAQRLFVVTTRETAIATLSAGGPA